MALCIAQPSSLAFFDVYMMSDDVIGALIVSCHCLRPYTGNVIVHIHYNLSLYFTASELAKRLLGVWFLASCCKSVNVLIKREVH